MVEVAAALDWGLRETSREAAVPPRPESKRKSNIGGDDQELPGQGDCRCLSIVRQEGDRRSQDLSASSLHPQQPQTFHPKSKQLVSTSQPVVSAQ